MWCPLIHALARTGIISPALLPFLAVPWEESQPHPGIPHLFFPVSGWDLGGWQWEGAAGGGGTQEREGWELSPWASDCLIGVLVMVLNGVGT